MNETNIHIDCSDHIPGVRKMFYCFLDAINQMATPRHVNQWRIGDIQLKPDRYWGRIWFLSESGKFDEPVTDTESGDLYHLSANGQLLSTDELATTSLMALSRRELILLIEDEKGNLRVIGNKEKGVRLKVSQSSATITGSVFGYSFSFAFVSDGPAYWFLGNIEETSNGGELIPDGRDQLKLLDIEVTPSTISATQNIDTVSFTESGNDLSIVVSRLYVFDNEGTSLTTNPSFTFKIPGPKKIYCYFFTIDSLLIGYQVIDITIQQADYILDIVPNAERAYSPARLLKGDFLGSLIRAIRVSDSDVKDIYPNNFGVFDKSDYDIWLNGSSGRCAFLNNQSGSVVTSAFGSGVTTHQPLIDFDTETFIVGAFLGGTWFLSHGGNNTLMGGFSISFVFVASSSNDLSNFLIYSNAPASRFTLSANLTNLSLVSSGTGTVNTGIATSSSFRHFLLRCNTTGFEIYINGVLIRSGASTSDVFSFVALIFQNGAKIKEYIAWSRRLNDYEIGELFTNINTAYGL